MIFDITITLDTSSVSVNSTDDIAIEIVLDAEQIPPASICSQIDDCLGISQTGSATKYLNEQGNWVTIGGGGQSYTFENGLTEDNGTVVLGGDILQDTYVTYDTVNTGNPMGLFYLLDGIVENLTPPNEAVFFGELPDFANMSTRNGYTVINSDNGAQGCIIGNEKAVIEVVKQPEGYGTIELEVYSPDDTIVSALKVTPDYLTFGDYFNASNLYLSLDGDLDLYQLGKIDGGTFYEVDNGNSNHNFYAPTGITNQIDDTGAFYFGEKTTEGSWRFIVDNGNMKIEKLVSGSWVTKQTLV